MTDINTYKDNSIKLKRVTSASEFKKKEALRCYFCGGAHCNRCSSTAFQSLNTVAIPNLHSSWIDDTILAMQRPSDSILTEGKVLENFVQKKIKAVFNLTEPGSLDYIYSQLLSY